MPIATTAEQRAAADAIRAWARDADVLATVRAQESDPSAWQRHWGDARRARPAAVTVLRRPAGTIADLAVLLEQCAAALVPGPVLGTRAGQCRARRRARAGRARRSMPVALTADGRAARRHHRPARPGPARRSCCPALRATAGEQWFIVGRRRARREAGRRARRRPVAPDRRAAPRRRCRRAGRPARCATSPSP